VILGLLFRDEQLEMLRQFAFITRLAPVQFDLSVLSLAFAWFSSVSFFAFHLRHHLMHCEAAVSIAKNIAMSTLFAFLSSFQDEVTHRASAPNPHVHQHGDMNLVNVFLGAICTREFLRDNMGLFYLGALLGAFTCLFTFSRMTSTAMRIYIRFVKEEKIPHTELDSHSKREWQHRVAHSEMLISSFVLGYLMKQCLVYWTTGQAPPTDCWRHPARCASSAPDMMILSLALLGLGCLWVVLHFYNLHKLGVHGLNTQLHLAATFAWLFLHMVEVAMFQAMLLGGAADSVVRTPIFHGTQVALVVTVPCMLLVGVLQHLRPCYPDFTASAESFCDCMSWMSALLWGRVLWLAINNAAEAASSPLPAKVGLGVLAACVIVPAWWTRLVPVVSEPGPKRYDGDLDIMEIIAGPAPKRSNYVRS